MIVAKEAAPQEEVRPQEEAKPRDAFTQGASASAPSPSPPTVVMSPPPEEQPLAPTATTHAPPAYSVLPASPSHQESATRDISEGPRVHPHPDRRDYDAASARSVNEHSAGSAFSRGLLAMVASPIVAFLAALWGVGKFVEGLGKGLSMGPEAAYRSYQRREEKRVEKKAERRKSRMPV